MIGVGPLQIPAHHGQIQMPQMAAGFPHGHPGAVATFAQPQYVPGGPCPHMPCGGQPLQPQRYGPDGLPPQVGQTGMQPGMEAPQTQ
jgi:hypothetical protein